MQALLQRGGHMSSDYGISQCILKLPSMPTCGPRTLQPESAQSRLWCMLPGSPVVNRAVNAAPEQVPRRRADEPEHDEARARVVAAVQERRVAARAAGHVGHALPQHVQPLGVQGTHLLTSQTSPQ